jgi:hypothetical protein
VKRCLELTVGNTELEIGSQVATFSSVFFESGISNPVLAGGITLKTKDQDFSMSRRLYIRASHGSDFADDETATLVTKELSINNL